MPRKDLVVALAIAALALALRTVLVFLTPVISADGWAYLDFAREIRDGDWSGLRTGIHPGYPCVVVAFGAIFGGLIAGAYAASALFGALATIPFFAMVRDLAGRRVAIVATLLFACLPRMILEHSDTMTDGLFQFWFALGAALVWFAVTRGLFIYYLAAGVAAAGTYLVRPEGIYIAVAAVGLTILAKKWKAIPFALAGVLLFVALVFPLVRWHHEDTGKWSVTRRTGAASTMETVRGADTPGGRNWGRAFGRYATSTGKAGLLAIFPVLALAGAALAKGRIRPLAGVYLGCLWGGYSLAPILAAASGYPLSVRYVLPAVLFTLPFAAIAYVAAADRWKHRYVWSVVLAAALIAMSVRAVHPRRLEESPIRDAAEWLRANPPAGSLQTNIRRLGPYLGHRAPMMTENPELGPGDVLVIAERDLRDDNPALADALAAKFRVLRRFPPTDEPKRYPVLVYVTK